MVAYFESFSNYKRDSFKRIQVNVFDFIYFEDNTRGFTNRMLKEQLTGKKCFFGIEAKQ